MTQDVSIHRRILGSADINAALSDAAFVRAGLEFEAVLAEAEAECGVIPDQAGAVIAEVARQLVPDAAALAEAGARSGALVIPLIEALSEAVRSRDAAAASWVHYGSTSQDVIDTALVLCLREAMAMLDADLERAQNAAATLEESHRETVMLSRTLLQPAPPTTFGFKAGGWAHGVEEGRVGLVKAARTGLVLQFGGAAGTLSAFGRNGRQVARAVGRRLDLEVPQRPWHASRQGFAGLGASAGVAVGMLGKIARDVALMMQFEVGEVSEPVGERRGGSSAMPHKRNPSGSMVALAAATRVPGLVAGLLAGMVQEHERGVGGWQSEWLTLPQIFEAAGGAAAAMADVLEGLEVHPQAMKANLEATLGLVYSERVFLALVATLGRGQAKALVAAACRQVTETGRTLAEILAADPAVTAIVDAEAIAALTRPEGYLGLAEYHPEDRPR